MTASADPTFLTLAEVIEIHRDQVERYGGRPGVRDMGLLQSAIAVPQATFGGERLHADVLAMAAAYAFHIARNHPFVDGNKRTGLAAALVFLEINGIGLTDPDGRLYDAMMGVATGQTTKEMLARVIRALPAE